MNAKAWNGEPEDLAHNPNRTGHGVPYRCTVCTWTGRGGVLALEHHITTGHDVRGQHWPASWPNAQLSAQAAPSAERI